MRTFRLIAVSGIAPSPGPTTSKSSPGRICWPSKYCSEARIWSASRGSGAPRCRPSRYVEISASVCDPVGVLDGARNGVIP